MFPSYVSNFTISNSLLPSNSKVWLHLEVGPKYFSHSPGKLKIRLYIPILSRQWPLSVQYETDENLNSIFFQIILDKSNSGLADYILSGSNRSILYGPYIDTNVHQTVIHKSKITVMFSARYRFSSDRYKYFHGKVWKNYLYFDVKIWLIHIYRYSLYQIWYLGQIYRCIELYGKSIGLPIWKGYWNSTVALVLCRNYLFNVRHWTLGVWPKSLNKMRRTRPGRIMNKNSIWQTSLLR